MAAFNLVSAVSDIITPHRFPSQPAPTDPRVVDYAKQAVERSRHVLDNGATVKRHQYGEAAAQCLDVWRWGAGGHRRPALIFFHGGAWIRGYPWWNGFMAPGVWEAGGVLISPGYRLAPDNRFPDQLDDVAAAMRWVRDNADLVGVDRDNIVVGGHSAGGQLSSLAFLQKEAAYRQCFAVSSPFDLRYRDATPESGEYRVYKYLLKEREDDASASPITHVGNAPAPFYIVFGDKDFERVRGSSKRMSAALQDVGGTVVLEEFEGKDHFDTHLDLSEPSHSFFQQLKKAFE